VMIIAIVTMVGLALAAVLMKEYDLIEVEVSAGGVIRVTIRRRSTG